MSIWGALKSWADMIGYGTNKNSPDAMSPVVKDWQVNLGLVRTIYGGWPALYKQRNLYLPQHEKEELQDYLIRARRPTFYNGFAQTVRALAGAPFSQPPTPEGVPQEILDLYEDDIDNEGTAGDQFVRHTFQDALITGLAGIFVNMPVLVVPEGQEATRSDELAAGIRPYWELIPMDDLVSFRATVENGKALLAQLVFWDRRQAPDGEFGVQIVQRLRVYRRFPAVDTSPQFVAWGIYEKGKDAKWQRVETGILPTVTEIPFAQVYTERTDFMCANPPLLDLAHVNLLHYQTSSDFHHALHLANVPVLFLIGFGDGEVAIGPNRALLAPTQKPDEVAARWLETTGAQLGSTRAVLSDLEEQMAHLGLGMLQRKSRAAETAQKATLDRKDQESTLGSAVSDLENGLEQALFWTAQYLGLPDGGRLTFTRSFEIDPIAAAATEGQGAAQPAKEPKAPGETNNPNTTS